MKRIFGINFSPLDFEATVEILSAAPPEGSGTRLIVTSNMDHVVNLTKDSPQREKYREAYRNAWLITADGWPVYAYAKLRGLPLPSRITGSDLCNALFDKLNPHLHRIFMLASSDETAKRLHQRCINRGFNSDSIKFVVPSFGFENDVYYSQALAELIFDHRTTHLFLGLGSPKSEIWIDSHKHRLGDLYSFGFGAGLDFLAGTKSRAPRWMQVFGMEWMWRLGQEPARLAPRYLLNSRIFISAVLRDIRKT